MEMFAYTEDEVLQFYRIVSSISTAVPEVNEQL